MSKLKEIAQNTGEAYEKLETFQARQEVTAGNLRLEAQVKFRKPRNLVVDYEKYENPFEDFEVEFSGGPEFNSEDLEGARLIYDGRNTWVHLLDKDVAYQKKGKRLYSPFTGIELIGQLGFLPDLVGDFLLKDEGAGEVNGVEVHRIGVKPKNSRRSLFLKEEIFSLDRAELAIGQETGLPVKISYYPGQEEQLRFSATQGGPVFVEYSGFRVDELTKDPFRFDSTRPERAFEEKSFSEEQFQNDFPVSLSFSSLKQEGYELSGKEISVNLEQHGERGFATVVFIKPDEESPRPTSSLQLLVGNYLSREMSRHRKFLSEHGKQVDREGLSGKLVDRGKKVSEKLPEEMKQSIYEVGWQEGESFYYLLGQGEDQEELLRIAASLVEN